MDDSTVDLGISGIEDAVPVGQGGFAVVYRAQQPAFGRTVAVKVLTVAELDDRSRDRFERECQAMGRLSDHPGIVTVYEAGFTQLGRPYLVMAFVEGGTLDDRINREGAANPEEVTRMGVTLAGALETAHHADVIHRDIKPGNVLLSGYGPQLSDFGIARIAGGPETRSGVVTASIAHAPPEILDGKRPTVAADVYSLGSTLYVFAAGAPAFVKDTDESILPLMLRIHTEPVPDLRERGMPGELANVIERSMAKDPAERPPSVLTLGRELQQVQERLGYQPTDLVLDPDHPEAAATAVTSTHHLVKEEAEPPAPSEVEVTRRPAAVETTPPVAPAGLGHRPPPAPPTDAGEAQAEAEAPARPSPWDRLTALPLAVRIASGLSVAAVGVLIAIVAIDGGEPGIPDTTAAAGVTPTTGPPETTVTTATTAEAEQPAPVTGSPFDPSDGPDAEPIDTPDVQAFHLADPPSIDGDPSDWPAGIQTYLSVNPVFGAGNWDGIDDVSAVWALGWDADFLYFVASVTDDIHAQDFNSTQIWRQDSLSFHFDMRRDDPSDLLNLNDTDDAEVIVSPGDFAGNAEVNAVISHGPSGGLQAFVVEDQGELFELAAQPRPSGYVVEGAIPWSLISPSDRVSVRPSGGEAFGLALNVNDGDRPGEPGSTQEVMLSSAPERKLGDPSTWGTLTLSDAETAGSAATVSPGS